MDYYDYAANNLLAHRAPMALLFLSSVGIDGLITVLKDCVHISSAVTFGACLDGL
jgi:hypothetical protein